jgi:hypothetical protein
MTRSFKKFKGSFLDSMQQPENFLMHPRLGSDSRRLWHLRIQSWSMPETGSRTCAPVALYLTCGLDVPQHCTKPVDNVCHSGALRTENGG